MIRRKIIMAEISCEVNGENGCMHWVDDVGCMYDGKCPYLKIEYSLLDPKGEDGEVNVE